MDPNQLFPVLTPTMVRDLGRGNYRTESSAPGYIAFCTDRCRNRYLRSYLGDELDSYFPGDVETPCEPPETDRIIVRVDPQGDGRHQAFELHGEQARLDVACHTCGHQLKYTAREE